MAYNPKSIIKLYYHVGPHLKYVFSSELIYYILLRIFRSQFHSVIITVSSYPAAADGL